MGTRPGCEGICWKGSTGNIALDHRGRAWFDNADIPNGKEALSHPNAVFWRSWVCTFCGRRWPRRRAGGQAWTGTQWDDRDFKQINKTCGSFPAVPPPPVQPGLHLPWSFPNVCPVEKRSWPCARQGLFPWLQGAALPAACPHGCSQHHKRLTLDCGPKNHLELPPGPLDKHPLPPG